MINMIILRHKGFIMMKIKMLGLSAIFLCLMGCSIGANNSYCESGAFGKFYYYEMFKSKHNYKNAGVCDNAYDIIGNREQTLKKAYKDFE